MSRLQAPMALLSRYRHWVGYWIALAATLPVLGVGLLLALPNLHAVTVHWTAGGFQRSSMVAALLAMGACLWMLRRSVPFRPLQFVLVTTLVGAYLRFFYAITIQPEWTSDFLTYWETAQAQIQSDDFTATGIYTERTLPLLVPLILLMGAEKMNVVLVNIAMLASLQLMGYDILRRVRSHQAAQGFTVAFLLFPLPYFASTIPSHDLWAMWMLGSCSWLLAFALHHRWPHSKWSLAAAGGLLALGCQWLELQRGIGLILAASLLLASSACWLTAPRPGSGQDSGRLRAVTIVCAFVLLLQPVLGWVAGASSLQAKASPGSQSYATAYFAANGTSFGNGTWDWMRLFQEAFTDPLRYSDTERLEEFSDALVLSDWSAQPLKRIGNASYRLKGLFVFDESNYWYFHGLDSAFDRPTTWLRAYSGYLSLLFGLALLAALARMVVAPLPSAPVLAGLVVSAVAALALATFSENQARYLLWLWFVGPLFLAESFGRGTSARLRSHAAGAALLAAVAASWLVLLLALWVPVKTGYGVDEGRILSSWTRSLGKNSHSGPLVPVPHENPYAYVTHPGRLAFSMGDAIARSASHEVCLPDAGRFTLSFHLNATGQVQANSTVAVRYGPHEYAFSLPEGGPASYEEIRIPGIIGEGACRPLVFELEDKPSVVDRLDVYFVRFEPVRARHP